MFTTFMGDVWAGGWCEEVKNRANLSQVRLKIRLSLAIIKQNNEENEGYIFNSLKYYLKINEVKRFSIKH